MLSSGYNNFSRSFSHNKQPKTDLFLSEIKNRVANLELVVRLGINVSEILNKEIASISSYIPSDKEAMIIEDAISQPHGWLSRSHQICSRKELVERRKINLSKLIINEETGINAIEFLGTIFSRTADYTIAFMFIEASFEEMNYYLRKLEEYCNLAIGSLDEVNFGLSI